MRHLFLKVWAKRRALANVHAVSVQARLRRLSLRAGGRTGAAESIFVLHLPLHYTKELFFFPFPFKSKLHYFKFIEMKTLFQIPAAEPRARHCSSCVQMSRLDSELYEKA